MDFLDTLMTAFAVAVPSLVLAGWAWFKAHAAQTEAKWDDWVVSRVKDIARGVLADEQPPVAK